MSTPTVAAATPTSTMTAGGDAETTLAQIDQEFQQIGCLGHGGFGSVFLAKKKSGRKVAVKVIAFGLDCEDLEVEHDNFFREIDAVLKLECTSSAEKNNRDLSIIFLEDWFIGPGFACIVMNYADGGTLRDEIVSKMEGPNGEPYTERRIAWYALQLSEALAYAHERGIAHHDVKSSNVLIDRSGGFKLLLADFGSSVAPGEESVRFTEIYAAPELHLAVASGELSGLEADKIDSFGLGCILFEMLCCQKLVDLTEDQTLAEFIHEKNSVDAALNLPCVRLPWIPESYVPEADTPVVGYSRALWGLVKSLLEPLPCNRFTPTDLQKPLRQDPQSPLLAGTLSAAQVLRPGAPVTVDNVQLGMFVQRGMDWAEYEADGGVGSVGVVVRLDADAGYTEAAFPSRNPSLEPEPIHVRIGANNKFELQVGPTPMNDFYQGTTNPMSGGLIHGQDTSKYRLGQKINSNCMVVGIDHDRKVIMVAPMENIPIPALPFALPIHRAPVGPDPRKPLPQPEKWNQQLLFNVNDVDEKGIVLEQFYAVQGGMDLQHYEIISVTRIQAPSMWTAYANTREQVASENWGIANEQRLFHGSGRISPETLLENPDEFYQKCSTTRNGGSNEICFAQASTYCHQGSFRVGGGNGRKMILSRVALGRVDNRIAGHRDSAAPRPPRFAPLEYHSVHKNGHLGEVLYTINNPFQAYPEYIIAYKRLQQSGRRVVRARRPQNSSGGRRPRLVPQRPRQLISPLFSSPSGSSRGEIANSPVVQPPPNAFTTPPTTRRAEEEVRTPGSVAKMCVVCMEREVSQILVPCGHPCLCVVCGTPQGLTQLKHKCPECRATIQHIMRFYGKVVEQ